MKRIMTLIFFCILLLQQNNYSRAESPLFPLSGTWKFTSYSVMVDNETVTDDYHFEDGAWYSLTFSENGVLTVRTFENYSLLAQESSSYMTDGQKIVFGPFIWMDFPENCHYLITDHELRLIVGHNQYILTQESQDEAILESAMQPRLKPGDISKMTIDYGNSAHFTAAEMNAAIDVILRQFVYWYNCEMHYIAYTTDERSAAEFRYYADSRRLQTGTIYIDGIVFESSFHTPPEDKAQSGSGLAPDEEYTGWEWILLLSEDGEWELVTWGYC